MNIIESEKLTEYDDAVCTGWQCHRAIKPGRLCYQNSILTSVLNKQPYRSHTCCPPHLQPLCSRQVCYETLRTLPQPVDSAVENTAALHTHKAELLPRFRKYSVDCQEPSPNHIFKHGYSFTFQFLVNLPICSYHFRHAVIACHSTVSSQIILWQFMLLQDGTFLSKRLCVNDCCSAVLLHSSTSYLPVICCLCLSSPLSQSQRAGSGAH